MKQIRPTAGPIKKVWLSGAEADAFTISNTTLNTRSGIAPIGDHQTNSSLSTAQTLTPETDSNVLMFSVEDQNVRMRFDGNAADANTGFIFETGDVVTIEFEPGTTFSFIETTTTATIQYQWGKIG